MKEKLRTPEGKRCLGAIIAGMAILAGLIIVLQPGSAKAEAVWAGAEPMPGMELERVDDGENDFEDDDEEELNPEAPLIHLESREVNGNLVTLRGTFPDEGLLAELRLQVPREVIEVGVRPADESLIIDGKTIESEKFLMRKDLIFQLFTSIRISTDARFEIRLNLEKDLPNVPDFREWEIDAYYERSGKHIPDGNEPSADEPGEEAPEVESPSAPNDPSNTPMDDSEVAPNDAGDLDANESDIEPPSSNGHPEAGEDLRFGFSLPPVNENPMLSKRCGLKIGLVFDLSQSILEQDNAVDNMKLAARGIVKELAGTPTEIGLHTFNSTAPATYDQDQNILSVADTVTTLNLFSPEGIIEAEIRIDEIGVNRVYEHGGTNWEMALRRAQPFGYDAVYFITDGIPSTNHDFSIEPPTAYDRGQATHLSDLSAAIVAANELKASGTRVVPIMVHVEDSAQLVLSDDILMSREVALNALARGPQFYWYNELRDRNPSQAFDNKRLAIQKIEYAQDRFGRWAYYEERVAIDQHFRLRSAHQMAKDISSNTAPIFLNGYRDLGRQLAESIVEPCQGKFVVKKRLVDSMGNESEPARDWQFNVKTSSAIISEAGDNVSTTSRSTDGEGEFEVVLGEMSPNEITVEASEVQRNGYSVYQHEDVSGELKNAVCVINDGGKLVAAEVTNVGGPNDSNPGFRITVPRLTSNKAKLATVSCQMDNLKPTSIATPKAKKEAWTPGAVQVSDDETATLEYRIHLSNDSTDTPAVLDRPLDHPHFSDLVRPNGDLLITVQKQTDGVKLISLGDSVSRDKITAGNPIPIATKIEIPPRGELELKVSMPIRVTSKSEEEWNTLLKCEKLDTGEWKGGVQNSVIVNNDPNKTDDHACIPLLPPGSPSLKIEKVDASNHSVALEGAKFSVYRSNEDGEIDYDAVIAKDVDTNVVIENIGMGTLWVVETVAAPGYELLAHPIPFTVYNSSEGWTTAVEDQLAAVEFDSEDLTVHLQIADVQYPELPHTGGTGHGVKSIVGLLLLAVGVVALRRRKAIS